MSPSKFSLSSHYLSNSASAASSHRSLTTRFINILEFVYSFFPGPGTWPHTARFSMIIALSKVSFFSWPGTNVPGLTVSQRRTAGIHPFGTGVHLNCNIHFQYLFSCSRYQAAFFTLSLIVEKRVSALVV